VKSFQTAAAPVLYDILEKGGTEDWRKVLKEATGEDISTRAMMDYFKPLMSWLEEQNKAAISAGNSSIGILPVGLAGVSPAIT
jgi:hypothetical protein